MKKLRFRKVNDVDMSNTFSAHIVGGGRGYSQDVSAIESYSNDVSPCIKTVSSFTLIVEVYEEDTDIR